MKVVLASESQSRKRALDMLGLTCTQARLTKSPSETPTLLRSGKNSPRPRLAKLPAPPTTLSWPQATPS